MIAVNLSRQILTHIEALLKDQGVGYLTVKTLAASHPSPEYQRTRLFYEGYGFMELEVLKDLWGSDNPCSYMLKTIG